MVPSDQNAYVSFPKSKNDGARASAKKQSRGREKGLLSWAQKLIFSTVAGPSTFDHDNDVTGNQASDLDVDSASSDDIPDRTPQSVATGDLLYTGSVSPENTPDSPRQTSSLSSHLPGVREVVDGVNRFWMPDSKCSVCYKCNLKFHTFRRRHHCRQCGQVFCGHCSSLHVRDTNGTSRPPIRLCDSCSEVVRKHSVTNFESPGTSEFRPTRLGRTEAANTELVVSGGAISENIGEGSPFLERQPTSYIDGSRSVMSAAVTHLRGSVTALCRFVGLGDCHAEVLSSLALECAKSVVPRHPAAVFRCVKVKKIRGGVIGDSHLVHGVVFTQDVVDKRMTADITHCRVLLLESELTYQRGQRRLTQMSTLIEQECDALRILVNKIVDMKPNIVFCEKSVASVAQDMLRENQVSVMVNVPHTTMQRLSLCTAATIVASIDHASRDDIGYCQRFEVRREEGSPNRNSIAFLSGCTASNGCTICLRGNGRDRKGSELARAKRVLIWAVYLAYLLKEKTWLLSSIKALTLPVDQLSAKRDLSTYSHSLQVRQAKLKKFRVGEKSNIPTLMGVPLRRWLRWSATSPGFGNMTLCEAFTRTLDPRSDKRLIISNYENLHRTINRAFSRRVSTLGCVAYWISPQGGQCSGAIPYLLAVFGSDDQTMSGFLSKHFRLSDRRKCPALSTSCRAAGDRHRVVFEYLKKRVIVSAVRYNNDEVKVAKRKSDTNTNIEMWMTCTICGETAMPRSTISNTFSSFSFGKFIELLLFDTLYVSSACNHLLFREHLHHFSSGSLEILFKFEFITSYSSGISQYAGGINYHPPTACRLRDITAPFHASSSFLGTSDQGSRSLRSECCNPLLEALCILARVYCAVDEVLKNIFEFAVSAVACPLNVTRAVQPLYDLRKRLVRQKLDIASILSNYDYSTIINCLDGFGTSNSKDESLKRNTISSIKNSIASEGRERESTTSIDLLSTSTRAKHHYRLFCSSFFLLEKVFLGGTDNAESNSNVEKATSPAKFEKIEKPRRRSLESGKKQSHSASRRCLSTPKHVDKRERRKVPKSYNSIATLSKLCFEKCRRVFRQCLTRLPNWHTGLPGGVSGIDIPVNEADVCSILAYALVSTQMHSQMAAGWQYFTGRECCAIAWAMDREGETTTAEPNICMQVDVHSKSTSDSPSIHQESFSNSPVSSLLLPVTKDRTLNKFLPRMVSSSPPLGSADDQCPTLQGLRKCSSWPHKAGGHLHTVRISQGFEIEKVLLCGADFHPNVAFSDVETSASGGSEFEVTVYYALQFHALRHHLCCNESSFLRSLLRSEEFRSSGGKSGVSFAITHDRRYIVKQLNRYESSLLLSRGHALFWYFSKVLFHDIPSTLAMIYGFYQVNFRRGAERWKRSFVVMQNLKTLVRPVFSPPMKDCGARVDISETVVSFDLKGVQRNRSLGYSRPFTRKPVSETEATESEAESGDAGDASPKSSEFWAQSEAPVLWDQNLREYTQGLPLSLLGDDSKMLETAIFNDTLLLSNLDVVDYSLLVLVDEAHEVLATGIIDFFRPYTWDKQVETVGKSLAYIASGVRPTVVSPSDYVTRFRNAMATFFSGPSPTIPFFVVPSKRRKRSRLRFLKSCSCPDKN